MIKFLSNKKIQLLIITVLIFAAYSNTLKNEFTADEVGYILNWDTPKHFENIGRILTYESVPADEAGVYRPIKSLFIMVSWRFWNAKPFGYHLDGIFLHILNTFLVYFIVEQIIRGFVSRRRSVRHFEKAFGQSQSKTRSVYSDLTQASARQNRKSNSNVADKLVSSSFSKWLPALCALLFGLHPVQTEAITLLTSSFDSLGWTFYLLSIFGFLKASRGNIKWYFGSLICAFLAFFTYELTLSLPFALILFELTIFRVRKIQILKFVPYFLILFFYLVVRFVVLHLGVREGSYLGDSFYKTQLVMTFAYVKYLWVLLWPVNLTIDHKILPGVYSVIYKAFVSKEMLKDLSIFLPRVILNLGIIFGLLGLGAVGLLGRLGNFGKVLGFSIFWFFIALSPAAFLLPQSTIMAERYVYMANFGFCLAVAFSIFYLPFTISKKWNKVVVLLIIFAIVFAYGARTYVRNFDYHDTLTFWQKLADQSPDNALTKYTLARIYEEQGKYDPALNYYTEAISLQPGIIEINFRMGRILTRNGRLNEAISRYQQVLGTGNKYSIFATWDLGRLLRISQSAHAQIAPGSWAKYKFGPVSFEYPAWWLVSADKNSVVFDDLANPFSVVFSQDQLSEGQTPQDYVETRNEFGTLVRISEAKIDDFDRGFAKFFKDDDIERLEFYLFKGNRIVHVFVYPFNSTGSREFDRILGTITSQ